MSEEDLAWLSFHHGQVSCGHIQLVSVGLVSKRCHPSSSRFPRSQKVIQKGSPVFSVPKVRLKPSMVFPKGVFFCASALWREEIAMYPMLLGSGSDTRLGPKWRPVSTSLGVCIFKV